MVGIQFRLKLGNRCALTNWSWKAVPFSRSIDRENTISKLQICANYSKVPTRGWSESSADLEAEHGVTMDDMYDGEFPEWIWYMRRDILNATNSSVPRPRKWRRWILQLNKFVTCILLLLIINVTVIIVFNSPAYLSIFTKKWNFLSNSCCAARVRFRYLMRKKAHRQIK